MLQSLCKHGSEEAFEGEASSQIYWTSCVAHTIDLMLEGIGKLPDFKGVAKQTKELSISIYSYHKALAMTRRCTKEIVQPDATRFATTISH